MIELKEENINATLYFILDYNEADFTGELIFYDDHAGVKVGCPRNENFAIFPAHMQSHESCDMTGISGTVLHGHN